MSVDAGRVPERHRFWLAQPDSLQPSPCTEFCTLCVRDRESLASRPQRARREVWMAPNVPTGRRGRPGISAPLLDRQPVSLFDETRTVIRPFLQ
jgi:hypothetical protein